MTCAPTEPRSRTALEFQQVLQHYRQHQATHPLPDGWFEDIHGLKRAAQDLERGHEPDPFLLFTTDRWRGQMRVIIDLYDSASASLYIVDDSGDGLSSWEISDLLFTLIGVDIKPADIEPLLAARQDEERDEENGAFALADASGRGVPTALTSDAPGFEEAWELDLIFPYPPHNTVRA